MLSAYSAVNQGHCHPAIVASLCEQAQKLTLSSRAFHNSVFGVFAQRVGELFGWEMVLPMNTGAEAVESALKLARKWAYLRKGVPEGEAVVLSVAGNFHGRTLGVISMSTDPSARTGFGPYLPGVGPTFVDAGVDGPEERVIRFGEISDLERALELHGTRVAAFLVEPIQGEAGIVVPPSGYLRAVHALCKKHNVLATVFPRTRGASGVGTAFVRHCNTPVGAHHNGGHGGQSHACCRHPHVDGLEEPGYKGEGGTG